MRTVQRVCLHFSSPNPPINDVVVHPTGWLCFPASHNPNVSSQPDSAREWDIALTAALLANFRGFFRRKTKVPSKVVARTESRDRCGGKLVTDEIVLAVLFESPRLFAAYDFSRSLISGNSSSGEQSVTP